CAVHLHSFPTRRSSDLIVEPILKSLKQEGYTVPTPIQAKAIPLVLQGSDLLGVAQTGTGKTAAFAIPILQLLSKAGSGRKPIRRSEEHTSELQSRENLV